MSAVLSMRSRDVAVSDDDRMTSWSDIGQGVDAIKRATRCPRTFSNRSCLAMSEARSRAHIRPNPARSKSRPAVCCLTK